MNYKEINKQLDMHSVVSWLGLPENRAGFICCPVHNDHHESMKVYAHNVFCFACGAYFDSIGLTAHVKNISQYEASKLLCEAFALPFECSPKGREKPRKEQKRDLVAERISLWCEGLKRLLTLYVRIMAQHGLFCDWAEAILDNGFTMNDTEFFETYSERWEVFAWLETWKRYMNGNR